MESKVGRMGSSFYTLFAGEQRLAYLWQRALHTDMPNVPPRQRLEFYEFYNKELWERMFADCTLTPQRVARLKEYVADGDITLRRLVKSPSAGQMGMLIFDGEHIVIDPPPQDAEKVEIGTVMLPKSLAWSNLIVKERR